MLVSAEVVRSHIGYHAWASGLLVEAAVTLTAEELTRDFGTADKSVLGTLVHVFGADRLWLARLQREPANRFLTDADLSAGGAPKRLARAVSQLERVGRGTDR